MQFRLSKSRLLLSATVAFLACPKVGAIVISWNSDPRQLTGPSSDTETVNRQSNGALVDESFYFVIGNFTGGLVPSAANVNLWANSFVVFGAAKYKREDALAGTGLPPAIVSQFASDRILNSNTAPFTVGAPVYIWGFNVRPDTGLSTEWVLFTEADWKWPTASGSAGDGVGLYDVTDTPDPDSPGVTVQAVLGSIRSWVDVAPADGYHDSSAEPLFTTAAVTNNPPVARLTYEQWAASVFPQAAGGGTLQNAQPGDNPDGDSLTNYQEFIFNFDPRTADSDVTLPTFEVTTVAVGPEIFIETLIQRSPLAKINWLVEQSTNLQPGSWSNFGNTATDLSTSNIFRLRTPTSVANDTATSRFFRLRLNQP